MTPIGNLVPNLGTPPSLDAPGALSGPAPAQTGRVGNVTLTILAPPDGIEGPGGEIRLRLDSPTVGPEDIPMNELLGQLDAVGSLPAAPLMLNQAVTQLADGSAALAQAMQADPPLDAATAADLAASYEGQAVVVERSIRDLIENSTYPNFSDFLKELVKVAQDLRESATKAKLAAIEANYELMSAAADQMLVAANEAKASRDKEIAASRKEAIGQIISGAASIVINIAFGALGAGQVGLGISQATTSIITGSTSISASNDKTEGSTLQLNSDLANVAKQRLEAAAKLLEAEMAVAEDLREAAKSLRDMVLKLYQDFISSQSQIIQRANV